MERVKELDAKLKRAHKGLKDHLALEKKVRTFEERVWMHLPTFGVGSM